eukprot:Partr_v1_DN27070_c3_g2_i3_m28857 putative SET domain containing 9
MNYWKRLYPVQRLIARGALEAKNPIDPSLRANEAEWHQKILDWTAGLHAKSAQSKQNLMQTIFGFNPLVKESNIPGAGLGLFVGNGSISKGQLVSIYPGLQYRAHQDPTLLVSLRNHYLLQSSRSRFIDGKNVGLSAWQYKSVCARDMLPEGYPPADIGWMNRSADLTPLSLGQMANNAMNSTGPNVTYLEMKLDNLPREHLQYIPSLPYRQSSETDHDRINNAYIITRTIAVIVALRDIKEG